MSDDSICNDEDTIDSRDIIARIAVLQQLRQPGPVDLGNAEDNETGQDTLFHELAALEALAAVAADYIDDWEYGETLIRDTYFVTYAQELADEIGAIPRDVAWPMTCIDWEHAASELKTDYTALDFDGVTYWAR